MDDRSHRARDEPSPSRRDPVRWAAQVLLLVLLSPAWMLVLALGGVLVAIETLIRAARKLAGLGYAVAQGVDPFDSAGGRHADRNNRARRHEG